MRLQAHCISLLHDTALWTCTHFTRGLFQLCVLVPLEWMAESSNMSASRSVSFLKLHGGFSFSGQSCVSCSGQSTTSDTTQYTEQMQEHGHETVAKQLPSLLTLLRSVMEFAPDYLTRKCQHVLRGCKVCHTTSRVNNPTNNITSWNILSLPYTVHIINTEQCLVRLTYTSYHAYLRHEDLSFTPGYTGLSGCSVISQISSTSLLHWLQNQQHPWILCRCLPSAINRRKHLH
jgi:hypothetical protein